MPSIDPDAWRLSIPFALSLLALAIGPWDSPRRLWSSLVGLELAFWAKVTGVDWRHDRERVGAFETCLFAVLLALLSLGSLLSLAAGHPTT